MVKTLLKNKIILIAISLAAAGLVSAAVYVKTTQPKNSPESVSSNDSSTVTPPDTTSSNPNTSTSSSDNNPPATNSGNTAKSVISQKNQANSSYTLAVTNAFVDGDTVRVRTAISGASQGTCYYSFTKTGATAVSGSVPIVFIGPGYVCQNLDLPKSQFGGGSWLLTMYFSNGGGQSNSDSNWRVEIP